MSAYSTKMIWQCGEWWVSLIQDGQQVAYMTFAAWTALGATQQSIEDAILAAEAPSETEAGEMPLRLRD